MQASATKLEQATALSVWLPSKDVEKTVSLQIMPEGKGQAVVVVDVVGGSPAEQAGIKRGQKLVGISDPVRDSEVWDLGDRPSLRFVRDTLRLRRQGEIQLVLRDHLNASDPAWAPPSAAAPAQATPPQGDAAAAAGSEEDGSLTRSRLDTMLSDGEDEGANMTIGERMAAQYEAQQRAAAQATDVTRRIAKRKAYLDQVEQRNDSPLVAGLLLAFLGPPAVILGIAAANGYLDYLYGLSLTIR